MWIQKPGKLGKGLTPKKQEMRISGQSSWYFKQSHEKMISNHKRLSWISTKSTTTGHMYSFLLEFRKALFRQNSRSLKTFNLHNLSVSLMQWFTEKEYSVQKYRFKNNFSYLKRRIVSLVVVGLMSEDEKMDGDEGQPSSLRDDLSTNFVSNPNKGEFIL